MYGIYENGVILAQFVVPVSMTSNEPVFSSDTLSLKRSIAKRASQRWELSTKLEPLSYTANDLFVLFVQKGAFAPLDIIVPQNIGVIRKREDRGSTTLGTGNMDSPTIFMSTLNIIPKGTLIRFANHPKVYMTTTDMTGSSSNCGIHPPLRVGVTNQPIAWQDDVIMPVLIDSDHTKGMIFQDGMLMDNGEIKMVERL